MTNSTSSSHHSEPRIERATVIGDGAMGTLCALLLAEKGAAVRLWSNFPEQAADIQQHRENRTFLPGCPLPENIVVTADARAAFADPQLIVSAVPCQYIRGVWSRLEHWCPPNVPVATVTKGIEIETLKAPSEILTEIIEPAPVVALSGPSIAPEVARRQPCSVVAACAELGWAEFVQQAFSNEYFRVYTNSDLIGVEVAGAVKNVIALAAGILDGLEAGHNAKAALLTRGLVEVTRLGVALGARSDTFKGLAGVGDLVTTCFSPIGRNRTAGEKIGRGMSAEEVIRSTPSVIEGIPTTTAVLKLAARHNVQMPITEAVSLVLSGAKSPREAIAELMTRRLKHE